MSVLDTPRSARAVGLSSEPREDYKPAPTYRRGQKDAPPNPNHSVSTVGIPSSGTSPTKCESPTGPDILPADPSPVNAKPDHSLPQAHPAIAVLTTSTEDTTHTTEEDEIMTQDQTLATPTPAITLTTARPSAASAPSLTLSRDTSKSQRERVRIAVQHGNHTLTDIAKTTKLSRDQTSKMMSLMIRQGELRDVPTGSGERAVDIPHLENAPQTTRITTEPLVTAPKTPTGGQTDVPLAGTVAKAAHDAPPLVLAAQILGTLDDVRLQVLRLAEMAKESAIAHSKLEAIQRALQEDTP
ncbi:hypothetical protein HAP94_24935 [Acidithiobacillus ferrivorans]|nr:hypothetical protein [Acidithiobacillus ferrivorans]